MKIVDFDIDDAVAEDILLNLENVGIEELKVFKAFLLATKPKLDPLIICKGVAATFVEMIDGMATDYAIDFLIALIDKLIVLLEVKPVA